MPVKFSLHHAKPDKNGDLPIRASIFVCGKRFVTSAGYSISVDKWKNQRVVNNSKNAKKINSSTINSRLADIEKTFTDFENACKINKTEVTIDLIRQHYKTMLGKAKSQQVATEKSFLDYFDEFTSEQGQKNNWTIATDEKFAAVKNHIKNTIEIPSFEFFDEKGLNEYVKHFRDKKMRNSTIAKHLGFLKWFLRWATAKGYNTNNTYLSYKPKLKKSDKKVVFLTWDELMTVYNFDIPEGKKYLDRVRDVFCFCCFTSLRYSDVYNLKRSDIIGDVIYITTVKTADSISIELNKYSKAILEKYSDTPIADNKALPVISNQRMNDYVKDLGALCGLDEPTSVTYYSGNKRTDEVFPKHELLGTHTGRRTFICNALALGIPAQVVMKWTGHSDYKSMKPYVDVADKIKLENMNKFNQL